MGSGANWEEFRVKFLNLYANLPLNIRKEVIAILDNEPISWNGAYLEISGNTKKGQEILKKMKALNIL